MAKKEKTAKAVAKQTKLSRERGSAYDVYSQGGKQACKLASLDSSYVPLTELQKRYTFHDVSAKQSADHKRASTRQDRRRHSREVLYPVYQESEKRTPKGTQVVTQGSIRRIIQTTRPA